MAIVVPNIPLPDGNPVYSSGTVGNTVIDTILVVEHACRRCGKSPSLLTPENLDTAKNNLHFLLSALSNRGVNLWAVGEETLSLEAYRGRYTLPVGTENLLNLQYRISSRLAASSTVLTGLPFCQLAFATALQANVFGFKTGSAISGRFTIEYSQNGTVWTEFRQLGTVTFEAGWHWYSMDPALTFLTIRLRDLDDNPLTLADMMTSNGYSDRPLYGYNRDEWTNLPDKTTPGVPAQFYFDKLINPSLILWPVPIDDTARIVMWRQRRIQDVGSLAEKLEIPERWFESIIWSLAKNMAFELEGVTPDRITLCIQQASDALRDAELGESDQGPLRIQPNISGYTA